MQDVLFFQPLHQTVGDQLVVIGRAQVLGDVFEREEESREVLVLVEGVDFSGSDAVAVALAEFKQRGRLDGAFQMQMQLRLRKLVDETRRQWLGNLGHESDCIVRRDLRGRRKVCERRVHYGLNSRFRVTVASISPRARRAEISWPGFTAAASFSNLPDESNTRA